MTSEYQLRRIEIKSGWAIRQICFIYDDGQTWSVGNKFGSKESKEVILAPGEYLVRVTHEMFIQHWSAGAFVEFETNRGRIYTYESDITSRLPSETVRFDAKPGHQIKCLKIQRGVLEGITEEPVEVASIQDFKEWFCILRSRADSEPKCMDYFNESKAFKVFQAYRKHCKADLLLIDVQRNKIVDTFCSTSHNQIIQLKQSAYLKGRLVKNSKEDASIFSLGDWIQFCQLVFDRKTDALLLMLCLSVMIAGNLIYGYTTIINGHILSLFSGNVNPDEAKTLWMPKYICDNHFDGCKTIWEVRTVVIISMLLASLVHQLCQFFSSWLKAVARTNKFGDLQRKLFSHAMDQEMGYHDVMGGGLQKATDATTILDLATDLIPDFIGASIKFSTTIYMMMYMNINLAIFSLAILALNNMLVLKQLAEKGKRMRNITFKIGDLVKEVTQDTISQIGIVKTFSKEKEHLIELKKTAVVAKEAEMKSSMMTEFEGFSSSLAEKGTYALVLLFSSWLLNNQVQVISTATIGVFLLFYSSIGYQVENLLRLYRSLTSTLSRTEATIDFLKRKPTLENGCLETNSLNLQGNFQLKNVSFMYPSRPGKVVLHNLNLEIPSGKTTAIVGLSGSGKTTISHLLMRLYDVTAGEIILDGKYNVKDLDLRSYHDDIAIVNQNPSFFGRSIRENIAYGSRKPLTDDEIMVAAKFANADGFINSFRTGLDTQVGSGGAQLSGGQLQRLAIARAVIRNPKILIVDEATSSLDTINESIIHSNLNMLMKGKTVIIIAHRLSTIKNADQIICLKEGKVEEIGTHNDLKQRGGFYSNLIKSQLV